ALLSRPDGSGDPSYRGFETASNGRWVGRAADDRLPLVAAGAGAALSYWARRPSISRLSFSTGTAKAVPVPSIFATTTPTSAPLSSTSGPPLLPGLTSP